MMLPACPIVHLIISQTGISFAPLETLFDAMFGFRHPRKFFQQRLWTCVGQRIIHLHYLLVVSIAVANHHHHLFLALLTPMGDDPSFDHLHHQEPFVAIAYVNALPDLSLKRLTPRLEVLPRTLKPMPQAARHWRGC